MPRLSELRKLKEAEQQIAAEGAPSLNGQPNGVPGTPNSVANGLGANGPVANAKASDTGSISSARSHKSDISTISTASKTSKIIVIEDNRKPSFYELIAKDEGTYYFLMYLWS